MINKYLLVAFILSLLAIKSLYAQRTLCLTLSSNNQIEANLTGFYEYEFLKTSADYSMINFKIPSQAKYKNHTISFSKPVSNFGYNLFYLPDSNHNLYGGLGYYLYYYRLTLRDKGDNGFERFNQHVFNPVLGKRYLSISYKNISLDLGAEIGLFVISKFRYHLFYDVYGTKKTIDATINGGILAALNNRFILKYRLSKNLYVTSQIISGLLAGHLGGRIEKEILETNALGTTKTKIDENKKSWIFNGLTSPDFQLGIGVKF